MATLYPSQELTMNWSAAQWSEADDNAKNHVAPVDGDTVVFTANSSAAITLDSDQIDVELAAFNMIGYTGTFAMGAYDLDVDGPVTLDGTLTASAGAVIYCSGTFAKSAGMTALPAGLTVTLDGTGTVSCNSATGGKLIVNTSGTHTANPTSAGDGYWDSFTGTAGTFIDSGRLHTIAGTIDMSGISLTSTGIWLMSDTGNLTTGGAGNVVSELQIGAGVTATMTNNTRFAKGSTNATSTLQGAYNFFCKNPAADNFLDMAGTVNSQVTVQILMPADRSNNGAIKGGSLLLYQDSTTSYTLTQSGAITITGANVIRSSKDNKYMKLILGASGSSLGAVTLGYADGTNRHGILDLGDGAYTVTITSVVTGLAGLSNELDFGDAVITLSGTLNGSSITCTGEAAGTGSHAIVKGGTISNVSMPLDDEALDATNAANAGANTNVWFPGCNGGHQVLGGGFIGSAQAA